MAFCSCHLLRYQLLVKEFEQVKRERDKMADQLTVTGTVERTKVFCLAQRQTFACCCVTFLLPTFPPSLPSFLRSTFPSSHPPPSPFPFPLSLLPPSPPPSTLPTSLFPTSSSPPGAVFSGNCKGGELPAVDEFFFVAQNVKFSFNGPI